jgi:ParB/RepB/Spo0J family partition protein
VSTATETPILEFDPSECLPTEDNRPAERAGSNQRRESIQRYGQLVPGSVCPHPTMPGKYLILDGVGRWDDCQKLGITFRAMLHDKAVEEPERIKLRLQYNVIRRNMTPDEIADDASRYMALMKCTQEEAARELSLTPATLSRAMAVSRRIPPELKDRAALLKPSIVAMIATLPVEAMPEAIDYATTPGTDGRLPTREQVGFFNERFRVKKTRGSKPKTLGGVIDGREIAFTLLPDEPTDSVIEFFKGLIKKLGENRHIPPDSLGFLFNGKHAGSLKA